jgi:hypothetical protein
MKTPRLLNIPPALRRPDLIRRLPRNANFRDRTGEKANGCTVLGYVGILPPSFSAWLCQCDCGKRFIVSSNHLKQPQIGCGCKQAVHRLSGTRIYHAWHEMMARCYDRRHKAYARYGGKGITVCKRGILLASPAERFTAGAGDRTEQSQRGDELPPISLAVRWAGGWRGGEIYLSAWDRIRSCGAQVAAMVACGALFERRAIGDSSWPDYANGD